MRDSTNIRERAIYADSTIECERHLFSAPAPTKDQPNE